MRNPQIYKFERKLSPFNTELKSTRTDSGQTIGNEWKSVSYSLDSVLFMPMWSEFSDYKIVQLLKSSRVQTLGLTFRRT